MKFYQDFAFQPHSNNNLIAVDDVDLKNGRLEVDNMVQRRTGDQSLATSPPSMTKQDAVTKSDSSETR